MNKKEILKGNRLIAEYMGWKEDESGYYPHPQYEYDHKGNILHSTIGHYKGDKPLFMFYKSWDWLMPVVEKIEKEDCVDFTKLYCEQANKFYDFEINLRSDSDKSSFQTSSENKIEAIYFCVIQFIDWFNKEYKSDK